MTRPKTISPWATAELYDAPGKSWDQTPTKIEPNASLAVQGWQPGQAPPAQVENYLRAEERAMLRYLSAIEVQNWCRFDADFIPVGNAAARRPIARNTSTGFHGFITDELNSAVWLSPNGLDWASFDVRKPVPINPGGMLLHKALAFNDNHVAVVSDEGSPLVPDVWRPVFNVALSETSQDVKGLLTPDQYGVAMDVTWHEESKSFLIVAFASNVAEMEAPSLSLHRYEPDTQTMTQIVQIASGFAGGNVESLDARFVSAEDSVFVFAHDSSALAVLQTQYVASTDSFATFKLSPNFPAGFALKSAAFSTVDNLLVAIGRLSGDAIVLTSTDGLSWEQTATLGSADPNDIATKGSLYVAHVGGRIWYSTDAAMTWDWLESPLRVRSRAVLVNLGDRLAVVGSGILPGDTDPTTQIAYSLRLK